MKLSAILRGVVVLLFLVFLFKYLNLNNRHFTRPTKKFEPDLYVDLDTTRKCPSKVFYLKTHKTASSSVLNLLSRFAETRNLKIALPSNQHLSSFFPSSMEDSMLDKRSYPPDIHLLHSILNTEKTDHLFPKRDTLYLTILRNTSTQYRSSFQYFGLGRSRKPGEEKLTIEEFMEKIKKQPYNVKLPLFARNPMFMDLGYTSSQLRSKTQIEAAIERIEKLFDLVMIVELWEESLLLLKQKLCLEIDDLVVFDANVNLPGYASYTIGSDSEILEFNRADYSLYKHFYKKLKEEAKSIHSDDFIELRMAQKRWEEICIAGRQAKIAYGTKFYLGYKLKKDIPDEAKATCESLTRSELEYIEFFRKKLKPKIP